MSDSDDRGLVIEYVRMVIFSSPCKSDNGWNILVNKMLELEFSLSLILSSQSGVLLILERGSGSG